MMHKHIPGVYGSLHMVYPGGRHEALTLTRPHLKNMRDVNYHAYLAAEFCTWSLYESRWHSMQFSLACRRGIVFG